jgi:hypothetical protein
MSGPGGMPMPGGIEVSGPAGGIIGSAILCFC